MFNQAVMNAVVIQSDCLYETIKNRDTHPLDRSHCLGQLPLLCAYIEEAVKQGLSDEGCYTLEEKMDICHKLTVVEA